MPLRAVVYQADLLNHGKKDHHTHSYYEGSYGADEDYSHYANPFNFLNSQAQNCSYTNLSPQPLLSMSENEYNNITPSPRYTQKKESRKACPRGRRWSGEMSEEVLMHHQRVTHIAVERNRRKQVNEYLSTIRSLMPHSYASKGDQASIVGGAINFVKELEQKLQWIEIHKRYDNPTTLDNNSSPLALSFADFITSSHDHVTSDSCLLLEEKMKMINDNAAHVEVSVAECFANLKIKAICGPVKNQQLLRILEHLDECKLTVLHLNVSSADQVILYTICLKVEDGCNLTSGDEIVASVHQLLSTRAERS